jgi:molybdopterin molybdotransferase
MTEPPVNQLLTVAEAIAILDAASVHPRIERISLQSASTRRLAQDLIADRDDPPFDKSLMDGYALRAADGNVLRIVGDIPAGQSASRSIEPGESMSIMTGAPIPPGADAVVPIEQTSRDGDTLRIQITPKPGQAIAPRGQDCRAGTAVLRRGTALGPAQIAVAASIGAATIDVFARPRVAILSTGDEIVPIDEQPAPTQIRNSNSHMLHALLTRLGCDVHDLGIIADDPELIRAKMEAGLSNNDALFVTGGMSMGEYDYVPRLLAEMGVEIRISKLRIKPGKPFVFGVRASDDAPRSPNGAPHVHAGLPPDKLVFGLPGNPVSGYVCTLRLAARLLARIAGGQPTEASTAILRQALPPNGPREFYQPAILNNAGEIDPLTWKGSADIYTLSAASALIIREENAPAAPIGAIVHCIRMP